VAKSSSIAVYDLSGATFDVSALEVGDLAEGGKLHRKENIESQSCDPQPSALAAKARRARAGIDVVPVLRITAAR
jgi:hypothetical protein